VDNRKTAIGSPYWMAPEVIQQEEYSFQADIWSLGITAIELATGRPPLADIHAFRAIFMIPTRPSPKLGEIAGKHPSPELEDFLASCFVKNPAKRASCDELLRHPFLKKCEGKPRNFLVSLIQRANKNKSNVKIVLDQIFDGDPSKKSNAKEKNEIADQSKDKQDNNPIQLPKRPFGIENRYVPRQQKDQEMRDKLREQFREQEKTNDEFRTFMEVSDQKILDDEKDRKTNREQIEMKQKNDIKQEQKLTEKESKENNKQKEIQSQKEFYQKNNEDEEENEDEDKNVNGGTIVMKRFSEIMNSIKEVQFEDAKNNYEREKQESKNKEEQKKIQRRSSLPSLVSQSLSHTPLISLRQSTAANASGLYGYKDTSQMIWNDDDELIEQNEADEEDDVGIKEYGEETNDNNTEEQVKEQHKEGEKLNDYQQTIQSSPQSPKNQIFDNNIVQGIYIQAYSSSPDICKKPQQQQIQTLPERESLLPIRQDDNEQQYKHRKTKTSSESSPFRQYSAVPL
ncbi:MAG: putative TRAF2 and NCK interacting kinase S homeolog, partial [Streblomastix strix]